MSWSRVALSCSQTQPHQKLCPGLITGGGSSEAGRVQRMEVCSLTTLNAGSYAKCSIHVPCCHPQELHELVVIASLMQQKKWAQKCQLICLGSYICYRGAQSHSVSFDRVSLRLNTVRQQPSPNVRCFSLCLRVLQGLHHLLSRDTPSSSQT